MSIFFLEAFEKVYKSKIEEYIELSRNADLKVKQTEPDMILHVQNKYNEENKIITFRWMEVFNNFKAFKEHLDNPNLKEHFLKFKEKNVLSEPVLVKIYCDWTKKQRLEIKDIPGMEIKFVEIVNGFFR